MMLVESVYQGGFVRGRGYAKSSRGYLCHTQSTDETQVPIPSVPRLSDTMTIPRALMLQNTRFGSRVCSFACGGVNEGTSCGTPGLFGGSLGVSRVQSVGKSFAASFQPPSV